MPLALPGTANMKKVRIPVHPLSRCVLLAEYGREPLRIGYRDLLFSMLTTARLRDRSGTQRAAETLTASVELEVNDELARHLAVNYYQVGMLLFSWHKDLMCRHAETATAGGARAWGAIRHWLDARGVGEDDYGMEAAYKCWQRWNESIEEKNPEFFGQKTGAAGVDLAKKLPDQIRLKLFIPDIEVELALNRFLTILRDRRVPLPKPFPGMARCFFYRAVGHLTEREASELLGVPRTSIGYGYRTLLNWIDTNDAVCAAWQACLRPTTPARAPASSPA